MGDGGGRTAAPFAGLLPRRADGGLDRRAMLEHGSMALALLGLGWLCLSGAGVGRGAFVVAFVSAIPLYLATRAWRLPWWFALLPALLPLSLGAVALVHLEAWNLSAAARIGYGVVLLLGATAWASSARRRLALGLGLVANALVAFVASVAGWIVGGDPLAVLRGSLDWHNQTAILLIGALCVALSLAVLADGRLAWVATAAAALLGTGVVLTNSRFGLALAAAPLLAGLVTAIVRLARRRAVGPLLRWAIVGVGATLLVLLLRSPLLFPGTAVDTNPAAGVIERGTLDSSWESRLAFWRAALAMGLDHPLAGGGLWSFAREGVCYADRPVMWHPHSEWLYAWAQGGLLALVPLVGVLVVGVVVLVVRALRPRSGEPSVWAEPARAGALLAVVLAVAHLTTEYDLSYLPLVGAMAVYAAIAAAPIAGAPSAESRGSRIASGAIVVAVVAVSAISIAIDPRAELFPWTGPLATACGAWL